VTARQTDDPGTRLPLSRERVFQAAVELADEQGVEALTMRELGHRLGVEAMSLYNHVANKDDILDGMVDLVVDEIDLPTGVDWRQAMYRRAVSAREAFARHPWAIQLIDSRETSGHARLRYFDWVLGHLRRAGFSLELAARSFSVLDSYIYGFGRQQAHVAQPEDGATPEEMAEAFLRAVPAEEYPYLNEMIVEHAMKSGYDESADFDFGLGIILDGLQRLLETPREE
jgi:AcrR family transcriptional regulator